MDIRSDKGISLAELLVTMSLLFVIVSMAYMATDVIDKSNAVSNRQAHFSREISEPLHVLDKVLSQNKRIQSSWNGKTSDAYTLIADSPRTSGSSDYRRYVFEADASHRFTQKIYRIPNSGSPTLIETNVWSETNVNRTKGAVFTYLGPSGETTAPAGATSVIVRLWTEDDGRQYSGERQIFFRNR